MDENVAKAMPEDVRKAVERDWSNARVNAGLVRAMAQLDPRARNLNHVADDLVGLCNDIDVIRAHLVAREAEAEQVNRSVETYREILIGIIKVVRERDDSQLQAHIDATGITAHLSENSRG